MRLAISTTETLTDLKTDLVVANNNDNNICFLTCICPWQISQNLTCLCVVVGPGLVSTSSTFMRSIASHPAGLHGRLAQKNVIGPPLLGAGGATQFAQGLPDHCDSSTVCRLCHLEPFFTCPSVFHGNTTHPSNHMLYIWVS